MHIYTRRITEPILCAPNDPDDARLLSQVAGDKVDEVFIGSWYVCVCVCVCVFIVCLCVCPSDWSCCWRQG